MDRLVPEPPRLAALYRRLARLPAGSSTGMACASAGFACVLGLLVIGPSVGLPSLFRERTIMGLAQAAAPTPRTARTRETAQPAKAKVQIVLAAVVPPRSGGGQGPAAETAPPADTGPTEPGAVTPGPTPAPTRSPEAERSPTPTPVPAWRGSPSPAPSRAPRHREDATPTPSQSHEPTDDDRATPVPSRSPDR